METGGDFRALKDLAVVHTISNRSQVEAGTSMPSLPKTKSSSGGVALPYNLVVSSGKPPSRRERIKKVFRNSIRVKSAVPSTAAGLGDQTPPLLNKPQTSGVAKALSDKKQKRRADKARVKQLAEAERVSTQPTSHHPSTRRGKRRTDATFSRAVRLSRGSRLSSTLPGLGEFVGDVMLYARGWYVMWWEPDVRKVYTDFSALFSQPGFGLSALVQCLLHIEGRERTQENVRNILDQSIFASVYRDALNLTRDNVLRYWNSWEGTRQYVEFQAALLRFGNHIIWAPVVAVLKVVLAGSFWRGVDAALTILARFVPPLDIVLSVADIAIASSSVIKVLIDRARLFFLNKCYAGSVCI